MARRLNFCTVKLAPRERKTYEFQPVENSSGATDFLSVGVGHAGICNYTSRQRMTDLFEEENSAS